MGKLKLVYLRFLTLKIMQKFAFFRQTAPNI